MSIFKNILILFIWFNGILLNAQEFQFNLYFVDAIGNKDTLIFGYDNDATEGLDSIFGEKNIYYEEWDTTFEIRILNAAFSILSDSILFTTKKQITPNFCESKVFPYVSAIGVKCANYPILIRWNSSKFMQACIQNSLITDWHPGSWFDAKQGGEQGPFLFQDFDSCIFTHTTHNQKENIYGILDLLFITLANNFQLFTGIEEEKTGKSAISIYPNPANSMITVEQNRNEPFILIIYDVIGNLIYQQENLEQVELQCIPPGCYIMQIKYKDQVISRRLVIN